MLPFVRAASLVLALFLAAPLAVAQGEPEDPWKRTACNALGCVHTDDRDEDGRPDYANGAFAHADLAYLNLNVNRTNVSWWGGFTFEEHEALHGPDDKALGMDSWGYANLTAQDGGPGFNDTDVHVLAFWFVHDTGEFETIREEDAYLSYRDLDALLP